MKILQESCGQGHSCKNLTRLVFFVRIMEEASIFGKISSKSDEENHLISCSLWSTVLESAFTERGELFLGLHNSG